MFTFPAGALRLSLLCAMFATAAPVVAKPISYVGGTMLMFERDYTGYSLSADYTFSPRFAAALYARRERHEAEFTTMGPQLNALVKRWNLPDGQGNIFIMGGTGAAVEPGHTRYAAWTTLLTDYETRRIFSSYEAQYMYVRGMAGSVWQRGRLGVAPYLANYNDLNTWFMVQVDHHPDKSRSTTVTPLVRFFYKTLLLEGGVSTRGNVMVNLVKQF